MKMVQKLAPVLVLLVLSGSARAQATFQGYVLDSLTSSPLVGANVLLQGTGLGASTDLEGHFRVDNISSGKYNVRVSYIGYSVRTLALMLEDGANVRMDVKLLPQEVQGKEVVVTAQVKGQLAAINQQVRSNTIVNVVSEEKIQELPDANAAESIGRLPGVSLIRSGGEANKVILRGLSEKFTNITIDGVQIPSTDSTNRTVDLSTISQSSLSGIELYKALTPDKDADAIAGSINLVTKRAPAERTIRLDMSGDYNELMNSANQYNFSLRYGERFFGNLLGVQLHGNLENRLRSSENVDLNYDQGLSNQTDYAIRNFTLQFNNETRKRSGFSALFDLNTPDNGVIRFNTVYSGTRRDIIASTRDYPTSSGGSTSGSSVNYSARDQTQNISTLNLALLGDNRLSAVKIDWGLSFAQSSSEFPYDYLADFLEPSLMNGSATVSGMAPTPTIKTDPEQLVPYALNNFKAATLYDGYYSTKRNYDRQRVAHLNLAGDYSFSNSLSGQLKMGGKYRIQDKSNLQGRTYAPYYLGYWEPYETTSGGTIQKKDLSGTYFDSFYQNYLKSSANVFVSFNDFLDQQPDSREIFRLYDLNPIVNRDKLEQWYSLNKDGIDQTGKTHEYSSDPTANTYNYSITERISAAYIMNTLNVGSFFTFIAGIRVENENNDYASRYSPIQTGGFPIPPDASKDTTGAHEETIWLPNFHLNIKPADFVNVRLAAYRALARPDFNYRLNTYFAWRDVQAGGAKQLLLGNSTLRDAKAWNYEVNASFFGDKIGLISVSAFYKEITDMFHMLNQINTSGNGLIEYLGLQWKTLHTGSYSLTVPYNSDKPTTVWGIEFEHQMNFAFLPGLLRNIVLSYNASIVRSETHIIGTEIDTVEYYVPGIPVPFYRYDERIVDRKQQLENQPEFYGNISLGYDIGGFSGRLSLFHQSQYNVSFTPSGRSDIVANPFTRVDLAMRQRLSGYLSLLLNVNNLTNVKEGNSLYNRVNEYKILNTSERYGITADFGVIIEL